MRNWIILFVFSLLLLTACMFFEQKHSVTLTITDIYGMPVSYARTTWVSSNGLEFHLQADVRGVAYVSLPAGRYQVIVEDGFFYHIDEIVVSKPVNLAKSLSSYDKNHIACVTRWKDGDAVDMLVAGSGVCFALMEVSGCGFISTEFPLFVLPQIGEDVETRATFWVKSPDSDLSPLVYHELPRGASARILEIYPQEVLSRTVTAEDWVEPPIRTVFPVTSLRNAGDLCQGSSLISGQDGIVNVWDLIYLLNRYKTNDPSADIGRMGDTLTLPPTGPFVANVNPDGYVDVWDLILLLNAYGATWDKVNTPFPPVIDSVVTTPTPNTFSIQWHPVFSNDVQEQYRLYDLNNPGQFSTSAAALKTVSKSASQTTFSTTKSHIALCAVNTSAGYPNTFFSSPTFFTLPAPSLPQLFFQSPTYSVPVGGTITVRVLTQGLPSFQTLELLLGFTGDLQLSGVTAGTIFNTNARLLNGQNPSEFFVHATHLYGQSNALFEGALLTCTIVANTSGSLFFNDARAIDTSLNVSTLQTGSPVTIQVY